MMKQQIFLNAMINYNIYKKNKVQNDIKNKEQLFSTKYYKYIMGNYNLL